MFYARGAPSDGRRMKLVGYNGGALASWASDIRSSDSVRLDVVLLERIVARDASAVGDLYDRHSRLLYGLILRILRDRSEAEEVLQEVFVLIWNRAATYNAALGSPAAWFVGIARNRAIDRLRANTSRRRVVEDGPVASPAAGARGVDAAASPEMRASAGEQQRAVMRALEGIPREQRELIEEAYYLGFTQSELAARHKLPLGTVKTRMRTGLLTLRERLSQIGVD